MEWRAPRASGALHLSALDVPRYYSPIGGSSGAAGGCRIGRGRCPSAPWPRRHHAREPLASTPFQRMLARLRSRPNPRFKPGQRQRQGNQLRRPALILPTRLNIPTRLGSASPSITTSLLRHQNLMQNSHTRVKLTFHWCSTPGISSSATLWGGLLDRMRNAQRIESGAHHDLQ